MPEHITHCHSFVIRSLAISSPMHVSNGVIGVLARIREIIGFALPGLVVFGELNNLRHFPIEFWLRSP
jgi:hypothetical protein